MLRTGMQGSALMGIVLLMGAVGSGCLDRPLVAQNPTNKTTFTASVSQSAIDKIDILFDIDNSASMGDKQAYLVQAIPQMIARLVTPRCVDAGGNPVVPAANADPSKGTCVTGRPEFTAVHDMHIGVVTSSLGSRQGILAQEKAADGTITTTPICDPGLQITSTAGLTMNAHNDDQGHLIDRTGPLGGGPALAKTALPEGGGFLDWFPTLGNAGATAVSSTVGDYATIGDAGAPGTLVGDFTELVGGAGESGCGIESQLESWYRFLVQPDPYASIVLTNGLAAWSGVDTTILQQRHDFLRPDSLVAIIVLSDENDSEIDVRSIGGQGYQFLSTVLQPPRATAICATNPNDPACMSCPTAKACGGATPPADCKDPGCTAGEVNGVYEGVYPASPGNEWGYNLNLRHVHMEQKYGLNPQFPLTRYYNGLTSGTVPNRLGEYPAGATSYTGTNNCTNPLFASSLPTGSGIADAMDANPSEIGTTLCALPTGALRAAGDLFYAHIGGVPHELLQVDAAACTAAHCTGAPTDAPTCATDCAQKSALVAADWQPILGASAAAYTPDATGAFPEVAYDYTGIDPHMIEAMSPRSQLAGPAFGAGADPVRPDPINGREWITNEGAHSLLVDREYACIFQLPPASQRDCATYVEASVEGTSCDCDPGGAWQSGGPAVPTGNTDSEVSPLCSKTSTDGTSVTSAVNDYTVQTYAKAYPTIRELTLANMMGKQGIVSSLCPIHTEEATPGDPLYGYRPAVNAIVDRLKGALGAECVPKLTPQATGDAGEVGAVPCLVLVSFAASTEPKGTACASIGAPGSYTEVDPTVLAGFDTAQRSAAGDAGAAVDLANQVTCTLNQVAVAAGSTCVDKGTPGWCYVTGSAVGASTCTQEIAYSSNDVVPSGATVSLQCISENE
jgi:hypothetical protein